VNAGEASFTDAQIVDDDRNGPVSLSRRDAHGIDGSAGRGRGGWRPLSRWARDEREVRNALGLP